MITATVTFTDELGEHHHSWETGPYDPKRPITCPACLQRLATLREELRVRYGLEKEWWK